jgi:hypothetical protein
MGWSGLTNGILLQIAQRQFDVFITADSNLTFQQNLATFDLAVLVLETQSTRLADTMPLMPQVLSALTTIQPRQVIRIRPEV